MKAVVEMFLAKVGTWQSDWGTVVAVARLCSSLNARRRWLDRLLFGMQVRRRSAC